VTVGTAVQVSQSEAVLPTVVVVEAFLRGMVLPHSSLPLTALSVVVGKVFLLGFLVSLVLLRSLLPYTC
jgi:hypothetical protein